MKAKKLPSGQWRARAYSHKDEQGKEYYESFTADTKAEAEAKASAFKYKKKRIVKQDNCTLGEAIDEYIRDREGVLSPSTVTGYKGIRKNYFGSLMAQKARSITEQMVQKAIGLDTHSVKTQKTLLR